MSVKAAVLLGRNTLVSVFVFAFDLALLWALVHFGSLDKLIAAALAFIAANSLHYALGRTWIFRGTERPVVSGYVYFFINAGIGLVLTVVLFAAFMQVTGLGYIVARIVASVFAGLMTFVLNAVLNFRSV